MRLRVGILAIGSLFWDSTAARQRWRQTLTDEKVFVKATIRYGRKSSSRGNTYTMVFSSSAGVGQARVLSAAPITSAEGLVEQAVALWTAEKNGNNSNDSISANWGCVVLCTNPGSSVPESLVEEWSDRVEKEIANYRGFTTAENERNLVTESGRLDIPWPMQANGEQLEFDLVLATANYPFQPGEPRPYPTTQQIADAWIAKPEFSNYFVSNREHGILTFQDGEIADRLRLGGINPDPLSCTSYQTFE